MGSDPEHLKKGLYELIFPTVVSCSMSWTYTSLSLMTKQADFLPSRPSSSVCYILSTISGGALTVRDRWVCPLAEFSFSLRNGEAWALSRALRTAGGSPLAASRGMKNLPDLVAPVHHLIELLAVDGERGGIILPGCFGSLIVGMPSGCSCAYGKPLL